MFTGELCSRTRFSLAEILVMVGGAIIPAPAVPASAMISAMPKCVGNSSRVTVCVCQAPTSTRSQVAGRLKEESRRVASGYTIVGDSLYSPVCYWQFSVEID